MPTRQEIIGALTAILQPETGVRAAWLAGSDATGRTDPASDIDLAVLARPGAEELVFARTKLALTNIGAIEASWRLPSPTWHGHEQCFYQLAGCGHAGLIDVVVIDSDPETWLVTERHGTPRVLFDKDGRIAPVPLDRTAHQDQVRRHVEAARGRFRLLASIADKEAERGRALDAASFYHGLVLRPLVDLLRGVHCPDRHDFGLRYLWADLPDALVRELERLAYPRDVDDLRACTARCRTLFADAERAWAARHGPGAGRSRARRSP